MPSDILPMIRDIGIIVMAVMVTAAAATLTVVVRELTPDEDLKDAGACAKPFEEIP